jgi:hypothetical protein
VDEAAMTGALAWSGDWAWSLPLIVLLHVLGLGFINANVVRILSVVKNHRNYLTIFCMVMGVTVLLATTLHGLEATIWAFAYRLLGALPDDKSAILYARGNHDLRPQQSLPCRALAVDGCPRGTQRPNPLRPVDGVPLWPDPTRLAGRNPRMASASGTGATELAARPPALFICN